MTVTGAQSKTVRVVKAATNRNMKETLPALVKTFDQMFTSWGLARGHIGITHIDFSGRDGMSKHPTLRRCFDTNIRGGELSFAQ